MSPGTSPRPPSVPRYLPSRPVSSHSIPTRPVPSRLAPPRPAPSRLIPSCLIPSQPVLSHPIPSRTAPSRPVPSYPISSHHVLSHLLPSRRKPSRPVPSRPVPSHPIPSRPVVIFRSHFGSRRPLLRWRCAALAGFCHRRDAKRGPRVRVSPRRAPARSAPVDKGSLVHKPPQTVKPYGWPFLFWSSWERQA